MTNQPNRDEFFFLDPSYQNQVPNNVQLRFTTLGAGTKIGMGCLWGVTVGWLLFLALVCSMLSVFIPIVLPLDGKDMETEGVITACISQSLPKLAPYALEIHYRYSVNGQTFENNDTIARGAAGCRQFSEGMTLNIAYRADNLSYSYIDDPASQPNIEDFINILCLLCVTIPSLIYLIYQIGRGPYLTYRYVMAVRHYPRLVKNGQLISGYIETIRGDMGKAAYNLYVTYHFKTPDGRMLTRKQRAQRDDLQDKSLPPKGTPVWVLYADDHAVVML